jgi:hypothetical protein
MKASDVLLIQVDASMYLGAYRNIVVTDAGGPLDVGHMRAIGEAYGKVLESYPNGIAALGLIRAGTPVASADARNESARFIREYAESLHVVAMVIEGEGVLQQMLRTVVRGINVLSRNAKMTVLGTADEGVRAVAPYLSRKDFTEDPVDELTAVVRLMRSGFRPSRRVALANRA